MEQIKLDIPIFQPPADPVCCGSAVAPPASEKERPGYRICRYVAGFHDSAVGPVPMVATGLDWFDHLGAVLVRLGLTRDSYNIAPGLYCLGTPGPESPVLVSANYKLTFDHLRRELSGLNMQSETHSPQLEVSRCSLSASGLVSESDESNLPYGDSPWLGVSQSLLPAAVSFNIWLLILDTRGVNVWCAAAHKTFGTAELLHRISESGLAEIVSHRRLILPQLGASGVDAGAVRRGSGFEVLWGPIRAEDLGRYLVAAGKIEPAMRKLTFTFPERLVLTPVELVMAIKPSFLILFFMLLISGIGPGSYSFGVGWSRWLSLAAAFLAGLISGAVLVPALLPWLPFRSFYLKGIVAGLVPATALILWFGANPWPEALAMLFICLAVSSYLAMNFTGATPYASPSGVEWEMRRAIPVQLLLTSAALLLWLAQPFI